MVSPLPEASWAPETRRFGDIRGLQWRMTLGVFPPSASVDDIRRATADSRRRYANLRGRLLVDPQIIKDRYSPPNLVMDNPLSQNPDSTWSRFFRNAELERMVDQDLSRLYPEHGGYFQTPGCQGLLRRILLIWCLRHPECGYRQGMHELLAPLLYVLQVDVERLSEVRKLHEDHFTDRFDSLLYQENDLSYRFDVRNSSDLEDEVDSHENPSKIKSLDELDPKIRNIVLLGDAYGVEGELGIVFSDKFMEHDAYSMFDALMNGAHGSVAMVDFFSYSPASGSHTGLPPVIEASAALYHLLSHVDSSLHDHLVDLSVEPQYFALRWLRVLFGREFSLDNLLIIWDEIFLSDNSKVEKHDEDNPDYGFLIFNSSRGAFISALAVAMLLHLRSSLLATENPTVCLQRLLNFPTDTNIKKLLEKAKSFQSLALSTDISSSIPSSVGFHNQGKSTISRSVALPYESGSLRTSLKLLSDSYWEEKWRLAHGAEELKDVVKNQVPTQNKGWSEKVNFSLMRAESNSSTFIKGGKKETNAAVRRSLSEDLSKELGSDEVEQQDDGSVDRNNYSAEDIFLNGNIGSEETSFIISDTASPLYETYNRGNYSDKSSVASNLCLDEINEISHSPIDSTLPASDCPKNFAHLSRNSAAHSKDGKWNTFQWLWRLGRNDVELLSKEGECTSQSLKLATCDNQITTAPSSTAKGHCGSLSSKGDSVDQNALRNIGLSMLEHIQVIESAFQQKQIQGTSPDNLWKGQVTAIAALKELRKISNLLSEM